MGVPQIVQARRMERGHRALRALRDWNGTFVQATTPFLADLLEAVEAGESAPPSLRIFVATGAAVPRSLAERATRILVHGGVRSVGHDGIVSRIARRAAPTNRLTCGAPTGARCSGIGLRIAGAEGQLLAAGDEGHFEVLSPTMFVGYADHPEWTKAAYTPDGWFRTGGISASWMKPASSASPVAFRDVINRGGEKVPVAEMEQLLSDHPSIAAIAIVAMPDERLGEQACAFAQLRPKMRFTFEQMQHYLYACQASKHYWPERLEIVDEMPRTAAGKIQKYVLRERARGLRPQELERATIG